MEYKFAQIENGAVVNISVASSPDWSCDGWVFCGDDVAIGWTYDGSAFNPPVVVKSQDQIQTELVAAVQRHLDATARSRNYDGILSLASYATSTNSTFAAEGQAGVEWRDAVWSYCYGVLADVQAQTRPIPTVEELVAELPVMVWPA